MGIKNFSHGLSRIIRLLVIWTIVLQRFHIWKKFFYSILEANCIFVFNTFFTTSSRLMRENLKCTSLQCINTSKTRVEERDLCFWRLNICVCFHQPLIQQYIVVLYPKLWNGTLPIMRERETDECELFTVGVILVLNSLFGWKKTNHLWHFITQYPTIRPQTRVFDHVYNDCCFISSIRIVYDSVIVTHTHHSSKTQLFHLHRFYPNYHP